MVTVCCSIGDHFLYQSKANDPLTRCVLGSVVELLLTCAPNITYICSTLSSQPVNAYVKGLMQQEIDCWLGTILKSMLQPWHFYFSSHRRLIQQCHPNVAPYLFSRRVCKRKDATCSTQQCNITESIGQDES